MKTMKRRRVTAIKDLISFHSGDRKTTALFTGISLGTLNRIYYGGKVSKGTASLVDEALRRANNVRRMIAKGQRPKKEDLKSI